MLLVLETVLSLTSVCCFFFNVLVLCLIARNFACFALRERDRWRKREREKKREGIPNTLRNFFCDDDRTKKNKFHP